MNLWVLLIAVTIHGQTAHSFVFVGGFYRCNAAMLAASRSIAKHGYDRFETQCKPVFVHGGEPSRKA